MFVFALSSIAALDTALRAHYWRAHQHPLASRSGAHPVQDHRNDLPSFERQCTSVSVVILHPCHWRAIPAETLVGFLWPTCCSAVQPFHRRQTGFPSFRRQLLEQSSITRDICTIARDIHLSYPDLIFWFSSCFIVDLAIILLFRPH